MPTLFVAHPFVVPAWGARELRGALEALAGLRRGEAARAEREISDAIGGRPGMATGSGRLALELALRDAGVGPGAEVIVPTFACAAVVSSVRRAGTRPTFADVGADLNVTPETVRAALTDRTRAVVVVHAGGRRAPVEDVAAAVGGAVTLIEDCAQSFGGRSGGEPWGSVGRYAIYSFGMGKNVMATAGGFVAAPRGSRFARLEPEGRTACASRLARVLLGYRLRRYTRPFVIALEMRRRRLAPEDTDAPYTRAGLSDMDAAILRAQLSRLDAILAARRRNALTLIEELDGDRRLELPDPRGHVFTKFYVQLRRATRPPRGERAPEVAALIRSLLREGFEPELAYTPLHLCYDGAATCPVAEERYWRTLALPVRPGLTTEECRRLAASVRRYLDRAA